MLGPRAISYADEEPIVEKNIYDVPEFSETTSTSAPQVSVSKNHNDALSKNKFRKCKQFHWFSNRMMDWS